MQPYVASFKLIETQSAEEEKTEKIIPLLILRIAL